MDGRYPLTAHTFKFMSPASSFMTDPPPAVRPLRRPRPIERGASEAAACLGFRRRPQNFSNRFRTPQAEKRGFVARVEIELNLELLLSQWYKNIWDQCNLLSNPRNLAMTLLRSLCWAAPTDTEDNDLLLPMQ